MDIQGSSNMSPVHKASPSYAESDDVPFTCGQSNQNLSPDEVLKSQEGHYGCGHWTSPHNPSEGILQVWDPALLCPTCDEAIIYSMGRKGGADLQGFTHESLK